MKKKDVQIVIKGKKVTDFKPVSIEIRYDDEKTWYAIEGFSVPLKNKKKARRG